MNRLLSFFKNLFAGDKADVKVESIEKVAEVKVVEENLTKEIEERLAEVSKVEKPKTVREIKEKAKKADAGAAAPKKEAAAPKAEGEAPKKRKPRKRPTKPKKEE